VADLVEERVGLAAVQWFQAVQALEQGLAAGRSRGSVPVSRV
jgi:hypothetical protein